MGAEKLSSKTKKIIYGKQLIFYGRESKINKELSNTEEIVRPPVKSIEKNGEK